MIPLATAEEMQRLDRLAIDVLGVPSPVLMESAGRAVADAAQELLAELGVPGPVLALAGPGNNGGDAVVAARLLHGRGVSVQVVEVGDPARFSPDLLAERAIAARLGVPSTPFERAGLMSLLESHPVVLDGLFGTGLVRPLSGPFLDAVKILEKSSAKVIAIDVPSGIEATTGAILGAAVRADRTVALAFQKLGHVLPPGRAHAGRTRVADIGIPPSLLSSVPLGAGRLEAEDVRHAFPPRPLDAHKGTFGHVLVIGGRPERPGSALLAGRAALRIGAGLVTLGSDEETIRRLAPALVELMGAAVGGPRIDHSAVLEILEDMDALVIGGSLDGRQQDRAAIREILGRAKVPTVIDAGALDAIALDLGAVAARSAPTVLTPHPGEAARVLGKTTAAVQADRLGAARAIAEAGRAIVVLKGASTIIAEPSGVAAVVTEGNPGMATAGSGDVLAGMIGGLLAGRRDPVLSARAGVYLHASAGDLGAAERGEASLIASDLIDQLPQAIGALLRP
ncbi:MAG: NAD(P)H-hydrate dehydratase [Myxococcota bacterium]